MRYATGACGVDALLQGGAPPGILLVCGEPASGKTALAASILRTHEDSGCVYISTTGYPEISWLEKAGATEALVVESQGGHLAVAAAEESIRCGAGVVVVDTVETGFAAGMTLRLSEMDDELTYEMAKSYAAALRDSVYSLAELAVRKQALAVFVVDVRADFKHRGRVRPNVPGPAVKAVDTVLALSRKRTVSESGAFDYADTTVKLLRSRHVAPGGLTRMRVWPHGVDSAYEKLVHLTARGILRRAGAYWKSDTLDVTLGPGVAAAVEQLKAGLGGIYGSDSDDRP